MCNTNNALILGIKDFRNRFPFSNTNIEQRLQCALGNAVQTKVYFIYFIPQASNDLRQAESFHGAFYPNVMELQVSSFY